MKLLEERSDLLGWIAIAGFVLAFDISSIKKGRKTLSSTVWNIKDHPINGPLAAAIWAAIGYHLFIFEPLKIAEKISEEIQQAQ